MRKLFVIFCLLIVNYSKAESPEWYSGVVVLKNKEILTGKVSVNQTHNLLLFQHGEKIMVYAAHKILSIRYFDEKANINRKFISIQRKKNQVNIHRLFELVLLGDISIIREPCSEFLYSEDEATGYRYYLRWREEIVPLRKFKSLFYSRLIGSSELLAGFIHQNKLNANYTSDIIKILQFHNIEQSGNVIVGNY